MTDSQQQPAGGAGTSGRPRITPYELVFTERFEAEVFPAIEAEANAHGVDAQLPDHFQLLRTVGEAIRDVVPEDAPPEALEQYRALLYHAFTFWSFGKRLYLLDPAVARFLVEAELGAEDWELALPHPAMYLQLPTNLFWGSISPDVNAEPVDGFFISSSTGEDPLGVPFHRIVVLAVLGIRRNRAGFSVIPFETESGPGIAAEWLGTEGMDERTDFQSTLPGGEMAGLYSIVAVREVLKLIGRALWYIDSFPEDVSPETAPGPRASDEPGALPPPRLEYRRVSLGARAGEGE